MKVLVTGSREWTNWAAIYTALATLPPGSTVVHGHCPRGADHIADILARAIGHSVVRIPADWNRYGRAAGPIRNRLMLTLHPDIEHVLAFPVPQSRGTVDMIRAATAAGKRVTVYREE